jgi:hypothetical protein
MAWREDTRRLSNDEQFDHFTKDRALALRKHGQAWTHSWTVGFSGFLPDLCGELHNEP